MTKIQKQNVIRFVYSISYGLTVLLFIELIEDTIINTFFQPTQLIGNGPWSFETFIITLSYHIIGLLIFIGIKNKSLRHLEEEIHYGTTYLSLANILVIYSIRGVIRILPELPSIGSYIRLITYYESFAHIDIRNFVFHLFNILLPLIYMIVALNYYRKARYVIKIR